MVGNLPNKTLREDLLNTFQTSCGSILKVTNKFGTSTERLRGVGFITFETADSLNTALSLHGQDFQGRPMKVTKFTKQLVRKKALGSVSVFIENIPKVAPIQEVRTALKTAFEACGKFLSVRVAMGTRTSGNEGFGWVVFVEGTLDWDKAMALKGTDILGQKIRVKRSQMVKKRKKDRRLTRDARRKAAGDKFQAAFEGKNGGDEEGKGDHGTNGDNQQQTYARKRVKLSAEGSVETDYSNDYASEVKVKVHTRDDHTGTTESAGGGGGGGEEEEQPRVKKQKKVKKDKKDKPRRKANSRSSTTGQVCFTFESTGSCARGSECPFVH